MPDDVQEFFSLSDRIAKTYAGFNSSGGRWLVRPAGGPARFDAAGRGRFAACKQPSRGRSPGPHSSLAKAPSARKPAHPELPLTS